MDWTWFHTTAVALVAALVLIPLGAKWLAPRIRAREVRRAIAQFRLDRETLEARFFDRARVGGKPRGLRWLDCDWQPDVTFARDLRTGLITAFIAVNVRFEAVEGGDMEDVAAVGTVRDACAVFHYNRGIWGTGGRALFNMNPRDAVERLAGQFEPLTEAAGLDAQTLENPKSKRGDT
ncbi:MAG TPA: hypothetical protein VML55_05605 [Planctomycetaceae bacterium]|nr:hypothetical protein [Planctomycetaceae bacterium]